MAALLRSHHPTVHLGAPNSTGWTLDFEYTFAHNRKSNSADYLRISVNGTPVFNQSGFKGNRNAPGRPCRSTLTRGLATTSSY